MRIHANTLTEDAVRKAAKDAGVTIVGLSRHGSRSRHHALEVGLSGSGRHGGQWGNLPHKSATWDEWGMFLEALFQADESVTVPRVYPDHRAFQFATAHRFDALTPAFQHVQHRWTEHYDAGTYYAHYCDCGAETRNPARGYSIAELAVAG